MNEWAQVFLGVIAAATLVMALIQIAATIAAARVGKQAQQAIGTAQQTLATAEQTIATARQAIASVREEIRPLIARAHAIVDEASKSATLATAQVEKIDRVLTDLSRRVEDTTAVVQQVIVTPAREALAVISALKAGVAALRAGGDPRARVSRSEEEDPLFIG